MTRLVLVDDHRMLREAMRRTMEEEGFSVIGEACDGDDAVRLVNEMRPDVVLMDVTMPNLDGVEATRRIKASVPMTQVVLLTMHADASVIRSAIEAGASGYLCKDCSTDELVAAVRAAADGIDLSPAMAASLLAAAGDDESDRILSPREEEVLQLYADGLSTPEVAGRLYISQKTVKNHLASIYEKLDARDRTQAVLQAVRLGIVRIR